jgi:glutamate-1-semialdehyde 2,1-aminomutase
MPSLVVSYTHDDAAVMKTIEAVDGALAVYAQALESGTSRFLVGRPSQVVFRRFNNGDERAEIITTPENPQAASNATKRQSETQLVATS